MASYDMSWRVTTSLVYSVAIGTHSTELAKAMGGIEAELTRLGRSSTDYVVRTDDEHILLIAEVETNHYPEKPKITVAPVFNTRSASA